MVDSASTMEIGYWDRQIDLVTISVNMQSGEKHTFDFEKAAILKFTEDVLKKYAPDMKDKIDRILDKSVHTHCLVENILEIIENNSHEKPSDKDEI